MQCSSLLPAAFSIPLPGRLQSNFWSQIWSERIVDAAKVFDQMDRIHATRSLKVKRSMAQRLRTGSNESSRAIMRTALVWASRKPATSSCGAEKRWASKNWLPFANRFLQAPGWLQRHSWGCKWIGRRLGKLAGRLADLALCADQQNCVVGSGKHGSSLNPAPSVATLIFQICHWSMH